MNNIKLTKVFENEYGIHVMVKSSAFIKINESEFFLITESTIRKGIRCPNLWGYSNDHMLQMKRIILQPAG